MRVVALAGGVGAARFLRGLVRVVDPGELVVVGNTGDDLRRHGLHVSPDLDTVVYTLGGGVDEERGWGRTGDTVAVASELRDRYGEPDWFRLGDRDLATHLVRSQILGDGGRLSDATARIAAAWELPFTLLPMTDDPVATMIRTADDEILHFQEWWVREGARPPVAQVWFDGIGQARPAPGVLEALRAADAVVLCPSNPVVSIGPILAVPGVREALRSSPVAGVSPIVGGRVVRGMADRLLPATGTEVSALGVARGFADFLDGWVIDHADASLEADVKALGVATAVTDTIMGDLETTARLAAATLDLARP